MVDQRKMKERTAAKRVIQGSQRVLLQQANLLQDAGTVSKINALPFERVLRGDPLGLFRVFCACYGLAILPPYEVKSKKARESRRKRSVGGCFLSLNPSRFPYSRPSISAASLSYELFIVMDTFVRDTRMMYCTFSKLRCNFFVLCFLYFNVRGILSLFLLFMKISL